jgi:hypothetical protein
MRQPSFLRREDGQTLPLVAICAVVLLLFAGLVIDVGRALVAQRQLQAAVDGAALAAGQGLPDATAAYTAAVAYGGATGEHNQLTGWGVSAGTPTVTFECNSHGLDYTSGSTPTCPSDASGSNCKPPGAQSPIPSGVTTCNAVEVTESATVKTTFLGLSLPSFNFTDSSLAAARGGVSHELNAYVILDNTNSMTQGCSSGVTGISTNPEKLDCAKAGMRALLQLLWPCDSSLSSCGTATPNSNGQLGANVAKPYDEVGLLVFPAISGNPPSNSTLAKEVDCNNGESFSDTYPTWTPYTYNASQPDGGIPTSDDYLGYQAVGLSSDFRPSAANTTLNGTTSNLAEAVGWGQCSGGTYPGGNYYGLKDIGGQGSYLAGAITEAQHLLDVNARPGVENAIIVESDGQLNDPKTFTDDDPCYSAIQAAAQAKAAGTTIYAIAYGDNGTQCPRKNYGSYTDVQTMQDIASSPSTFFNQPTAGSLTSTFTQIGDSLSSARLIPDCTLPPPNC